jgi:hypothetical protein
MKGLLASLATFNTAVILSFSASAKELPQEAPAPERPILQVAGVDSNGWFRLSIEQPSPLVYTVERSTNLRDWNAIALLHGHEDAIFPDLPFVDAGSGFHSHFYRVTAGSFRFEDDWRNQVYFSNDSFRSEQISFGLPETRWIKFAIATNEPSRVYYQNSWKYKFHYEFASERLPQFKGMNRAEFDAVSLWTNAQTVVLGAVLFSPKPESREAAIQFVGQDPYTAEQIADWFAIVRSTIVPLDGLNVTYIPTYEQVATAENNRAFLAARGIEVSSLAAWDTGENCYSPGWAIGTLKFVPAAQIAQAYADGTLTPDDILLTDAIPAEMPFLRGIISLAPSTPNSHVALLARSHHVPFAYFAEPELRALAQAAIGKEVIFTAYLGYPQTDLRVLDASQIDPALRQEIASAKELPPLNITPKTRFGAYLASTDSLRPDDIKFFGGKAANFGFLRREIPSNSPTALAISFDLWDDFMEQLLPGGISMRSAISNRLSKHAYPPNLPALRADLQAIQEMIKDQGIFTADHQQQIAAALLEKFDPQIKIRFRSSTNVEDTEEFVGAGLYDSYSGCLADDRDNDTAGPSICDPTEEKERGVFRAIRKVYASFYNENAVLERMRYKVNESQAGMAVLVHYSNPDETELANGVATVSFQRPSSGPGRQSQSASHYQAILATQKGAVSVTNPDGTAQPEVVNISFSGFSPYIEIRQWSSLVPFGATVLQRDAEYLSFAQFFSTIAKGFEAYYPNKTNYTLDFEYKKLVLGSLLVKQVRQLPAPDPDSTTTTYLLDAPVEWEVFQGEHGNVVANHRLKARFHLPTVNARLTSDTVQNSLFRSIEITYLNGEGTNTLTGVPASFPGAQHSVGQTDPSGTPVTDSWIMGNHRMGLTALVQDSSGPNQSPFITLADARVLWSADYATPLPSLDYGAQMMTVTNEDVLLRPVRQTNAGSILVTRTTPATKGAAITTQFYWPEYPKGPTAGYTAPLLKWVQTTIEGLTTEPIVLTDYFSQTYRPEHHNFGEYFLFEPALEPGISAEIIAELEAKNVRYIYLHSDSYDNQRNSIHVAGPDWQFRPLVPAPAGP